MWSEKFEFEYLILSWTARNLSGEITVELPLLMHEDRPVWIVSHLVWEKSRTRFEMLKSAGDYQIWRAKANIARPIKYESTAAEAA
ncbi:MAG: hypothetical protein ACLUKN_03500 [Bacilli bacterium]